MDQYIGKLLDNRYEILEVIGAGGMAVVYKAMCHRLNRPVAVKILRSDLASDAEFRRRFHDESQAVAMLSHPNIVAVYDVSRSTELEYIVMELIDGITLKQYMQKKGTPLNWREALHFITQIMKALSHAHGRGIIHRDIKPQNIMVLRDGSVKVADFGIARLASAAQSTLTQEALGSVHYISPEQARGSRVDTRSDLYSAGVVLYEMLTGRLPFEGESPVSVAIQHISSIPLAPKELNPDIPEALEAITIKAMASRLEQRYESADTMLHDLEEFRKNPSISFEYTAEDLFNGSDLVDEPTQVRPVSSSLGRRGGQVGQRYRTEEEDDYTAGSRWSAPAAVGVIAIFLIGVGYFLWVTFFSGLIQTVPEHRVPNLEGQMVSEVMTNQEITSVFSVVQGESVYSDAYAAGQIVSQDPEGGRTVKGDRTVITVTVSAGPEYVAVPDVVNKPYAQARIELEALGLKVTSESDYNEMTKNHVISSDPAVGTELAPGDPVVLLVSMGPKTEKVPVPYFIGQDIETVRNMLRELGLIEGSVVEVHDESTAGVVVYQSIKVNTEVDVGSTISFQVSKGPDQTNTTPAPTPSAAIYTKKITVDLPENLESVRVRVEVDGTVKFNNIVYRSMGSTIYPPLDGSGVQEVCVYFDDVLHERFDLDFSQ